EVCTQFRFFRDNRWRRQLTWTLCSSTRPRVIAPGVCVKNASGHVTVKPALNERDCIPQVPEHVAGDRGHRLYSLVSELYPICRSITGNGVRETLQAISERIPLAIHEVPSGTQVFDWTIPREWNIRDAYVKNSRGERVVDFRVSNLHVMSYSVPV